jgi:uncharacterized protein YegL
MNGSALTELEPWSLTVTPANGNVVVLAKASYKPTLIKVLGVDSFDISATSQATWSLGKVEVALALDNTGSMLSNNKLVELKKAVHNLLDVLKAAARNPGDAKVAIVPFDRMVNVSMNTYLNANVIKWDYWDDHYGSCSIGGNSNKNSCTSDHKCVGAKGSTKTKCENNGGTWTAGVWTPANHNEWNGCVVDRDKDPSGTDNDAKDTAPDPAVPATHFPAAKCGSLVTIMPLNYDWTALNDKVEAMAGAGNTNVTIGLTWAWHALSSTAPLTEGVTYGTPNVTKFIILLTDGDNTQNRWTNSQSAIDARTQLACANVKAAGIQLYTVRVIDGNADLLRNCATNPSMYYDVQDASQLASVFNTIGAQIANLHLSK